MDKFRTIVSRRLMCGVTSILELMMMFSLGLLSWPTLAMSPAVVRIGISFAISISISITCAWRDSTAMGYPMGYPMRNPWGRVGSGRFGCGIGTRVLVLSSRHPHRCVPCRRSAVRSLLQGTREAFDEHLDTGDPPRERSHQASSVQRKKSDLAGGRSASL